MGTHVRDRETLANRRNVLRTAGIMTGIAATGLSGVACACTLAAADPVFANIVDHKRLWRASNTAGEDTTSCRREMAALEVVLSTVPVSTPGLLAWLDHLESNMGFAGGMPSEAEFFTILRTVRAFAEACHA